MFTQPTYLINTGSKSVHFLGNSVRAMRSVFARDNSGGGGEEAKTAAVRPRPLLPKSLSRETNEDSVILGE